ncbi:radical SAM protein [Geobacter sp. DSM 9736]|uniref:radical SAM protein n=1 Tax=Geobacter sp. DSM 9736 TaxID=1277350 RepID=UPI000B509390|nr:radical SAM protein [Geobacter sp. DSM 9736]SNB47639.1 Radical SAM superfamily enzyme, MoaA/NifB/PqqE/SkfB family [Geobacter sp. DSM 9736]
MLQSLKDYSSEKVVSLLLSLATSASNETLARMTHIMEFIAKKEYYKERIRWIRQLIRENHPSIAFPLRILRELHPNQRDKWITNLAVNHLLSGTNQRKAWADREGYYPPSTVVISPTMKCNLSCYGCYAGDYRNTLELSLDEIDSVLMQVKEMGVYFAVVSGGEPFFKQDIFEIFKKHNDMAFLVFTHGGLVDEAVVEKLIEVGNVMPAFSLEGYEAETDERRGRGHFAKVMHAMDLLRENGLSFCGSFTQTSRNTGIVTSDEYIDMLVEKGCFALWLFTYVPVGREPDIELMAKPEQRDYLRRRVTEFRSSKPMLFVDFWNDGPIISGCIAGGRKYFHVNANGDIEPCVFCHFAVDNIRRTSLREALNSPLFKKIRQVQGENDNLLRPCMLIDHPEVGRELFSAHGTYPTHDGAEAIFSQLATRIDAYSADYAAIADPAWARESSDGRRAEAQVKK